MPIGRMIFNAVSSAMPILCNMQDELLRFHFRMWALRGCDKLCGCNADGADRKRENRDRVAKRGEALPRNAAHEAQRSVTLALIARRSEPPACTIERGQSHSTKS